MWAGQREGVTVARVPTIKKKETVAVAMEAVIFLSCFSPISAFSPTPKYITWDLRFAEQVT